MTEKAEAPPHPGRHAGLPSPGDVLAGKYSVEAVIGIGGMAVVVAARHLELDARVALKILLPKYRRDEEVVARFRREARAAVKIRSVHVARVHDVGTLEDGAPCLVMEYLDGLDLETLLGERGALPSRVAVDYVLQACEALAEAHSLGIVHRDLKPANLFLSRGADGAPLIKLLDFGISKVSSRERSGKKAAFGTLLYMSPEQLRASDAVDARADIWAMGAILHELIARRPPFDSDDLGELQAAILVGDPRPLRADCPDAPAGLEAVILRCLARRAEGRFASVAELAAALAPFGSAEAPELAASVARVAEATRGRSSVVDATLARPGTPIAFAPVPLRPSQEPTAGKTAISLAQSARPPSPKRGRRWWAAAILVGLVGLGAAAGVRRPDVVRAIETRIAQPLAAATVEPSTTITDHWEPTMPASAAASTAAPVNVTATDAGLAPTAAPITALGAASSAAPLASDAAATERTTSERLDAGRALTVPQPRWLPHAPGRSGDRLGSDRK